MKVFISWSGEPSRSIALALRHWLPLVVQHVRPWMSDEEISSGTRWNDTIAAALEDTDFGIVCVTASNQHRPWLMFEAGAIAKRLQGGLVVPLCIDLTPAEITGPLTSFQGRCLDKEGMRKLIYDVSAARDQPLATDQVEVLFEALWPGLQETVADARRQTSEIEASPRSNKDMLEELVERVRDIERQRDLAVSRASLDRIYERMRVLQSMLLELIPPESFQPVPRSSREEDSFPSPEFLPTERPSTGKDWAPRGGERASTEHERPLSSTGGERSTHTKPILHSSELQYTVATFGPDNPSPLAVGPDLPPPKVKPQVE